MKFRIKQEGDKFFPQFKNGVFTGFQYADFVDRKSPIGKSPYAQYQLFKPISFLSLQEAMDFI